MGREIERRVEWTIIKDGSEEGREGKRPVSGGVGHGGSGGEEDGA